MSKPRMLTQIHTQGSGTRSMDDTPPSIISGRSSPELRSIYNLTTQTTNICITRTCLAYLLHYDDPNGPTPETLPISPLYWYAAKYRLKHYRNASRNTRKKPIPSAVGAQEQLPYGLVSCTRSLPTLARSRSLGENPQGYPLALLRLLARLSRYG